MSIDLKELKNMVHSDYIVSSNLGIRPVIAAMCDVLKIPEYIDQFIGPLDPRVKMSIGTVVKALIINMLSGRTPLVHLEHTFTDIECGILFGEGILARDLNDDRLGDALDKISSLDYKKLYSLICMQALKIHNVDAEALHVDTTNISLEGDYKDIATGIFDITYGDPKSGRKDLKQANIGLVVQQDGLPIAGTGLSGNTSDVVWFRKAMEELNGTFQGDLMTRPIGVYDAAGSNEEMFNQAKDLEMPSIIRLSNRFSIANEYINRAWDKNSWFEVGSCSSFEDKKDKSEYKINSYDVAIGIGEWRLIVVYSSSLEKSKIATAKRNLPKTKEKLEKLSQKLSKVSFSTETEAIAAGKEFIKKNINRKAPYKYEVSIVENIQEKYLNKGKPTKESPKVKITTYQVNVTILDVDKDIYDKWLKEESCFIVVTNVPKERCTDEEILREYKSQWLVEERYKFLKQPTVLGPVWLQKKERVNGLIFILLLSVLVSLHTVQRLKISLATKANSSISLESENPRERKQNRKGSAVGARFLLADGRLIERPTFKTIVSTLSSIKVMSSIENDKLVTKFEYGIKMRLLQIVEFIGFHPSIYIEPFSTKMDLWQYSKG